MFKRIDFQSGCGLAPGHYLLKAERRQTLAGFAARFEREGAAYSRMAIRLEESGTMYAHFRAPVKISNDGEAPAATGAPVLSYIKLPLPVAALIKLTLGRRLKHKIGMPDRSGYVCILSGIAGLGELPALSRNAALQRALTVLNLDDQSISPPQLFDNPLQWLRPPRHQPLQPLKAKIATVLHLYYQELWPELASFLSQIQHPFDLWITHCGLDSALRTQILQTFPQAQFVRVENRGRDIWPFISLLNENVFKDYGCICKIHGKKSAQKPGQEETLFGSRWRRRALYDLIACGRAGHIAAMFEDSASLGIVGPGSLRVPNPRYTIEMAWGTDKNRKITLRLARQMGIQMDESRLDFFAGTMFWVRPEALEPVRRLNLRREDFPGEAGQRDGEPQHGLERLFTISALHAGFGAAEVPPVDVQLFA